MKIVITGATGFLGSRIADYYKNKYEIFTPSHTEMDICNIKTVQSYLHGIRPNIIIHCAAVSDVGMCEKEPERSWQINVNGSKNIAEIGNEVGAKCIMCSSDQVYFGSDVDTPHIEEERVTPFHGYGRQKLMMEQECLRINPRNVMLRLSWMYDSQKRNEQERDNFMTKLVVNLREHQKLYFPIYDKRGITNVAEVVHNIEKTFSIPGGVYNFGSYNDKSMYETMTNVFERMAFDEKLVIHKDNEAFADRHRNLCMSERKINEKRITFLTTTEGIYQALCENIQKL